MSLIARLKKSFINEGVEVNEPASSSAIEAFELEYGIKLPDVLKEYFLKFNGTGQGNFGESYFAFFSLPEFRPVSEELSDIHSDRYAYPGCFVFSDYLLWSWGYAVQLDDQGSDGPVFILASGHPAPRRVAESFSQFVWVYLKNHEELV